jgi:hypothetical protein
MIIGFAPLFIALAGNGRGLSQQLARSSKADGRVRKMAAKRSSAVGFPYADFGSIGRKKERS